MYTIGLDWTRCTITQHTLTLAYAPSPPPPPRSAIGDVFSSHSTEAIAAINLARKLAPAGRDHQKLGKAMDENWKEIYALADMVCERHISDHRKGAFLEPCTERLQKAEIDFDADWKAKLSA